MRSSDVTMFMSSNATSALHSFLINSSVSAQYLANRPRNTSFSSSDSSSLLTHDATNDRHCEPLSAEMKMMPARDTVAGDANRRSRISKIMRMFSFSGMRSLDASVNILLSSITLFMDSIQFVSRSPSSRIHLDDVLDSWPRSRMTLDSRPSFHSRVAMVMKPYSSSVDTDLGLMSTNLVLRPICPRAADSIFQHCDLPEPGGPMTKTQWRMANNSSSCTTFNMKSGSGFRPAEMTTPDTADSSCSSTLRGGFTLGNKSFNRPKNTTSSCCTIFGVLKSRSARISSACSFNSGSARLKPPATTSTDLTARRPQS